MIGVARSNWPADQRRTIELAVLIAILVLAALTRLPGLDARGQWDSDQGHDMLVLRAWVVDGELPLLGPKTSMGTFHHGAVYYWLLGPAAFLSGANPVAVTFELALIGIGAVAAVWWLGRLVGGAIAAAAAGLLAAVSPAGINESTFIWNPNPIPLAAGLAYVGAILARRTGRVRWWVLAGVGAMVTVQCHILGVVIVLPLAWAWAADLLARRRAGDAEGTRAVLRGGAAALAIILAGYLPLLAHELGNGFDETRSILDYLVGGGREAAGGAPGRIVIVGLRSLTWPFAGVITDRVTVSLVVALIATLLLAIAVLRRRPGEPGDTGAARWLLGGFGACVVALALFAPSLATVVPGLPNDHYHNLLDPIVLALAGVGLARLATAAVERRALAGRAAAGVLAAILAVVAVTAWPPAVAPDGGWPPADEASIRVLASTGDDTLALAGIPSFKSTDAMRFPLEHRGAEVLQPGTTEGAGHIVIVCDPLFDEVVGAPCGGPAEDAWVASTPGLPALVLVDRFEAGSRRWLSVYAAAP